MTDLIDLGHEKAVDDAIERHRTAPKGYRAKRAKEFQDARTAQLRYEVGKAERKDDKRAD